MAGAFRFLSTNIVFNSGASISASSFAPTLPPSFVLDQLWSKVWRSATGWTIVETFNDRIDFTEAGALVATLTPGTYATGALLAAEVQTQLNAAGGNTYTCTYSGATNKFTITKTAGADPITLNWATGPNLARSVGVDMGYSVADDSGGGPYESDLTNYQSRHYVLLTMSTSTRATLSAVVGHNLLTGAGAGSIRIQGDDNADFSLLDVDEALAAADDANILIADFDGDVGLTTSTYWRLLISDTQNPDGFSEIGAWVLGVPVETSVRPSTEYERSRDELSMITQAIDGANHGDLRPTRHVHTLSWTDLVEADRDILEAVQEANPPGRNFLINFDETDIGDSFYGFWSSGLEISMVAAIYWNVRGTFVEALG